MTFKKFYVTWHCNRRESRNEPVLIFSSRLPNTKPVFENRRYFRESEGALR